MLCSKVWNDLLFALVLIMKKFTASSSAAVAITAAFGYRCGGAKRHGLAVFVAKHLNLHLPEVEILLVFKARTDGQDVW